MYATSFLHLVIAVVVRDSAAVSESPVLHGEGDFRALICDAGSTGSRVYAYYLTSHSPHAIVNVELIGKTNLGISEYALLGEYSESVSPLVAILRLGLARLGSDTPIYINATGGVRQLPDSLKESLIKTLTVEIPKILKEHSGQLHVDWIDGSHEALYGLIAANYIMGGLLLHNLSKPLSDPIGVFDLGGSSLELSLAGLDGLVGSDDDVLLSFKTLGTNQVKERLLKSTSPSACIFDELTSGDECRAAIRKILLQIIEDEQINISKINSYQPSVYIGISAFVYFMDFTNWLMHLNPPSSTLFLSEYPSPSGQAMQEACNYVCGAGFLQSLFLQHEFTSNKEAPSRCFDICYAAELLPLFLGDPLGAGSIVFLAEANDLEIQWTLGYYISQIQHLFTESKTREEL